MRLRGRPVAVRKGDGQVVLPVVGGAEEHSLLRAEQSGPRMLLLPLLIHERPIPLKR